jgi:hypothetical protein
MVGIPAIWRERKRGHGAQKPLDLTPPLPRRWTKRGVKIERPAWRPAGGKTMRWACLVALAGMILTDIAVADIVRHGSIPRAYIGSWAPGDASCEPRSEGVVVLSANRYIGAETKCAVRGVYETAGPHGPIYSARMQCSGAAGGRRKSVRNLIIVPSGTGQLSLGSDFDNLKSYQRCQSSRSTATQ